MAWGPESFGGEGGAVHGSGAPWAAQESQGEEAFRGGRIGRYVPDAEVFQYVVADEALVGGGGCLE